MKDIDEMLRNKKMRVLCEGVEVLEHVDLLKSLNVSLLQGYYFGRPAPIENNENLKSKKLSA